MNTLERTSGNAYTPDKDYAAFSGRVVQKYVQKLGVTQDGYVIGRVTRVIDIGRPDKVEPIDLVEAMEPIEFEYQPNTEAANKVNKRRNDERWAIMQMDTIQYLRQYGPSHMSAMASDLEYAKTTLDEFVRQREGRIFCRVGNVGRAVLWGLVGVHDKEGAK